MGNRALDLVKVKILFLTVLFINSGFGYLSHSEFISNSEAVDTACEPNDSRKSTRASMRDSETKWTFNKSLISGVGNCGSYYASPTFADLDNDWDLDLLVGYSYYNTTVHEDFGEVIYYQNIGTPSTPKFKHKGIIKDDGGDEIKFIDVGSGCSPVLVDLDYDDDFDLVLGMYRWKQPNNGAIFYYENIGDKKNPIWRDKGAFVDNESKTININLQCSPRFGDIDNDSDFDLIIGSNNEIIMYRNTGTVFAPEWTKETSLIDNINTPGTRLTPTFVDLDYDDDLDLVIGAKKEENSTWWGKLYYYDNMGTKTVPNWHYECKLIDENSEEIKEGGANNKVAATFVDLDGDTDLDLVYFCASYPSSYEDPEATMYLDSFDLIDGHDASGDICYARYQYYTFNIKVTNNFGVHDIEYIDLQMDPQSENIQMRWNADNNSFYKTLDPEKYITIDKNGFIKTQDDRTLNLSFKIKFNLNFPHDNLNDCKIIMKSESTPLMETSIAKNVFRVENDLEFAGELYVNAEFAGNLTDLDLDERWVGSKEELSWTGLMVVYQDTVLSPPGSEFTVTVWDETGNSWSEADFTSGTINIKSKALDFSKEEANYVINITGIPAASDKSDSSFQLNVDADDIKFLNPKPIDNSWQNTKKVQCEITLEDFKKIETDSIRYRTSTDGIGNYNSWQSTNTINSEKNVTVNIEDEFDEGEDNYIQWSAEDFNNIILSEDINIKIDETPVNFSEKTIEYTKDDPTYIKFKVTLSDQLSGINQSSIKYWISKTGPTFSDNFLTDHHCDVINKTKIVCTSQFFIPNENNTYIKWEVEDNAKNKEELVVHVKTDGGSDILYHDVSLETEKTTIKIRQGELKVYQIKITNTGTGMDRFQVKIERGILHESTISIDQENEPFTLEPGKERILDLVLDVNREHTIGTYQVDIMVESTNHDTVYDYVTINVVVEEREDDQSNPYLGTWAAIIGLFAIIISIVIISLFIVIQRKRRRDPPTELPPISPATSTSQITNDQSIRGSNGFGVQTPSSPQELQTQQPLLQTFPQPALHGNLCSTCGQPLSFISQNNRYYCYGCQKYE